MDYEYTLNNLDDAFEKIKQGSTHEYLYEILDNSDFTTKLLLTDFLYTSGLSYPMKKYFNLSNENRLLAYFYAKHIGVEFEKAKEDYDSYHLDLTLTIFDNPMNLPKSELLTFIEPLVKRRPEHLDIIEEKYFNLILKDYELFFEKLESLYSKTDPYFVISNILSSNRVKKENKQEIFDNLLEKNPAYLSFDYDNLLNENINVFSEVKGLINKISEDGLLKLFDDSELKEYPEEYHEEIINYAASEFEKIIKFNLNDPDSLKFLIMKLENIRYIQDSVFLKRILESQTYKEACDSVKLGDDINKKILDDILSGNLSKEFEALYIKFAASDLMIENYDNLLALLLNGNEFDDKFNRHLATTLLIGLSNKIKKEKNLEFDLSFSNETMENDMFGYYQDKSDKENSSKKSKLYLNKYYIYSQEDYIDAFIEGVNTTYHELRHANQFQHLLGKKEWNYDSMVQAMDNYLIEDGYHESYYSDNYWFISFEVDARLESYIETRRFFKDYPHIQDDVDERFMEFIPAIKNKTRQGYLEPISTPLGMFKREIDLTIDVMKDQRREKEKANLTIEEWINQLFTKYPSLSLIFKYNTETETFEYQSEEYFQSKLQEFQNEPVSKESEEAIYCIQNILYDLKLTKHFENQDLYKVTEEKDEDAKDTLIDEIEREAISEVGAPPRRR